MQATQALCLKRPATKILGAHEHLTRDYTLPVQHCSMRATYIQPERATLKLSNGFGDQGLRFQMLFLHAEVYLVVFLIRRFMSILSHGYRGPVVRLEKR